jgi:penicillin-binding protein 2
LKEITAKAVTLNIMLLLFILQTTTNSIQDAPALERRPAVMSIIYLVGLTIIALLLLLSVFRNRSANIKSFAEDISDDVKQKLSSTATNRGLKFLRLLYVLMAFFVFGFHIYWAKYAEESNPKFQQLNYKDLRNRRLTEANLRGWILDRSGKLEKALARYKIDSQKNIVREYPLDSATVHLLGTERGDPGLERSLFGFELGAIPDSLQIALGQTLKQKASQDVRLTIDRDLQTAIVDQLKGRKGAVVILNPQTGDILGMYSNPSYSVNDVRDEADYIKLNANKKDEPLVNRVLNSYYVPGSTFKTLMMIGAQNAGLDYSEFLCSGSGFSAQQGAKLIFDDGGAKEVHGTIQMNHAYEVSCNQYFAQMALQLGGDRIRQTAEAVGIGVYQKPNETLQGKKRPDIINASTDAIKKSFAPTESTMIATPFNSVFRPYDLAIEGIGQGYAGQMTPLQMAMIASSIANNEGKLMKPKIEFDRNPEVFKQVLTPQSAQSLREIMGLVVKSGTARGVFGQVLSKGITAGGKTGTAQKVVPVYDPKTGEPKTVIKTEKDPKGNIIRQYEEIVLDYEHPRIDSWFLCIAPLENPQIAIAVIVEGGGYGARAAAPIAAALVFKAKELGLLGTIQNRRPE